MKLLERIWRTGERRRLRRYGFDVGEWSVGDAIKQMRIQIEQQEEYIERIEMPTAEQYRIGGIGGPPGMRYYGPNYQGHNIIAVAIKRIRIQIEHLEEHVERMENVLTEEQRAKIWPIWRGRGESCQRCGVGYDIIYQVPDDVWHRIMGKEGGLLCPECCFYLAGKLGISLYWEAAVDQYPSEIGGDDDGQK